MKTIFKTSVFRFPVSRKATQRHVCKTMFLWSKVYLNFEDEAFHKICDLKWGLEQPTFSIVIPTYQRPEQLAGGLESLIRLEYPPDRFKVIVVDGGSEKPLERVVAHSRNLLDLILLTQSNASPAVARKTGAARAHGKLLTFTDDDSRPSSHWLKTLAMRFAVTTDHIIGGRTLNALPGNIYSTTSQLMQEAVYAYYNERRFNKAVVKPALSIGGSKKLWLQPYGR